MPGHYRLEAMVTGPDIDDPSSLLSASVGEVAVQALPRDFRPPDTANAVEIGFGSDLQLVGYDLGRDGEVLTLVLHWHTLRRMAIDYKFFVHLYDAAGDVAVQHDGMPHDWTYPTTWWETDEFVSDEIRISLAGVSAGTYRLGIGIYDPATATRLPVTGWPPDLAAEEGRLLLPDVVVQ